MKHSAADMKNLNVTERIGPKQSLTPEGVLPCQDSAPQTGRFSEMISAALGGAVRIEASIAGS
jgi:hypothetical protein